MIRSYHFVCRLCPRLLDGCGNIKGGIKNRIVSPGRHWYADAKLLSKLWSWNLIRRNKPLWCANFFSANTSWHSNFLKPSPHCHRGVLPVSCLTGCSYLIWFYFFLMLMSLSLSSLSKITSEHQTVLEKGLESVSWGNTQLCSSRSVSRAQTEIPDSPRLQQTFKINAELLEHVHRGRSNISPATHHSLWIYVSE